MDFMDYADKVRRLGSGELRQLFIRIPGDRVLQMSLVDDATWSGLQIYAADDHDVGLLDLGDLGFLVDVDFVAKAD